MQQLLVFLHVLVNSAEVMDVLELVVLVQILTEQHHALLQDYVSQHVHQAMLIVIPVMLMVVKHN
jgi:DMSO reductase anchor subunit